MKGGYQIIDLREIGLELSDSTQSFTNVNILKQLRNLREYIEKNHDYSRALNDSLKVVLIRYRDGKNGEKVEACQFAKIECSNDSLTYEIIAKDLRIEVVFEEKTDDDGNKYYDIKTAKYLYNKNEIIEGDLLVSGDLNIGGNIEVDEASEVKVFENIVDKDGHKRFVDFDITTEEITGLTFTYAKASLSGSHLLIVLAGNCQNESEISSRLASFELPKWIYDKLAPVFLTEVDRKTVIMWASDFTTQQISMTLNKGGNNIINIYTNTLTLTKDRSFRLAFDLLIDNE